MIWTHNKPTKEGWYWWRAKYVKPTRQAKPMIVKLREVHLNKATSWDIGEWAGPLAPPKEEP